MEEEGRGLVNSIKTMAQLNDSATMLSNWGWFAGFFIAGVLVIMFASPFAAFLFINPKPFCMLFSMGSTMILIGLFQLINPRDLIKKTGSVIGASVYFISLALSLYAGLFRMGYFYTIAILITQFPGGKRGMKLMMGQITNLIKTGLQKIFGKKQSYLPL